MRAAVAKTCVRTVNGLSKLVGRGSGTVIGGRIGLMLDPNLLEKLARNREVVVVSGTNGKTTTTALIRAGWGRDALTNGTGANMPAGHVAALSAGRRDQSRAVLEVDESWLPYVLQQVQPKVVVLLNLSRDQLDRVSEVRQIALKWRTACSQLAPTTVVVANADDPLVVWAASTASSVKWVGASQQWNLDAVACPVCTSPLHFEGHIWSCSCGFKKPDVVAELRDGSLSVDGHNIALSLQIPGDFNQTNAALATIALGVVAVSVEQAVQRLGDVRDVAGRFSERMWRGHRVRVALAKNPAGFTAMLSTLGADDRYVAIGINDRVADGRDPSWLYDVPFEALKGKTVFCFGERALDLATRLDLAGVDFTLSQNSWPTEKVVPLIANYTAFRDVLEGSAQL